MRLTATHAASDQNLGSELLQGVRLRIVRRTASGFGTMYSCKKSFAARRSTVPRTCITQRDDRFSSHATPAGCCRRGMSPGAVQRQLHRPARFLPERAAVPLQRTRDQG